MRASIIDTQLPPKLALYLIKKGCDAIHTTGFPEGHLMPDSKIREIAINQNRIIITKDSDFFDFYLTKGAPPKVLLLKFGNLRNEELIFRFENQLDQVFALFDNGAEFVYWGTEGIFEY